MRGQGQEGNRSRVRVSSYADAGVDTEGAERSLDGLLRWVRKTGSLGTGLGRQVLDIGYFASVVQLTDTLGLAISTDGVGTKLLVAQRMGRLEGVGIDCVAMNVNDILCVGATPFAMVDYLAVEETDPEMLASIGESLYRGAAEARIVIAGGELAQVREMVRGTEAGKGFDLVGTCVGTVLLDGVIVGDGLADGDVVVGIASTGLHSNGFTLVRKVFEEVGWSLDRHVDDLGGALGETLLEPTAIYVPQVEALSEAGIRPKALVNVTGDGLLNLARVKSPASFVLTSIPEPAPIFRLIKELGTIPDEEMYSTFNMGIGFCVVCSREECETCLRAIAGSGRNAWPIGEVAADGKREVRLVERGLVGKGKRFRRE